MAITINKKASNSGRTAAGFDFYSGLILYGTAPTVDGKWGLSQSSLFPSVQVACQQMFSKDDIESSGIIPYSDNTASTATVLLTAAGVTGDNLVVKCLVKQKGLSDSLVTLCNYTVPLASTASLTLQGADIIALINSTTYLHGFSASFATATVTITAPKNQGIGLNTGTPYTAIPTGTIAVTVTQSVIAGTYSKMAIWAYHISEYFRKNPTGTVWVGIISATSNYNEILSLQSAAKNNIRQVGIYDDNATSGIAANIQGTCQKIQTSALLIDQTFPLEVIYSPNIKAVTDLSTMPSGQLVAYNKVSVITSQDGNALGNYLYRISGISIGNIGAKLGTLSSSRVSADDSQAIEQFNLSDGEENDIPAFANGQLLSSISLNLQAQLSAYRYIFFRVFTGNVSGTFWTANCCYCVQTNRYAFMNDNRVMDKVTRICNKVYIPLMNSEVIYNQDGTISQSQVEIFQDAGVDGITAEMITGYGSMPLMSGTPIVTVDPNQPLQKTNNLIVSVQIGENGIARDITINESFTN